MRVFLCLLILGIGQSQAFELQLPTFESGRGNARDSVIFLLSSFDPALVSRVRDQDTLLRLPDESLPAPVKVALINSTRSDGSFDHMEFRSQMGSFYLQSRAFQHPSFEIPDTLEAFKIKSSFLSWEKEVIARSMAKGLTRIVYRSPPEAPFEIRVAETLLSENGDVSAPVRETELLMRREKDSKNWDFYSYDSTGKLSTFSELRNGDLPTPAVCISCHYSARERQYIPLLN